MGVHKEEVTFVLRGQSRHVLDLEAENTAAVLWKVNCLCVHRVTKRPIHFSDLTLSSDLFEV